MGDFLDFQRGQIDGVRLAGARVTKTPLIRCIQSSSFQGYDDIHKSWEDIIIEENCVYKA